MPDPAARQQLRTRLGIGDRIAVGLLGRIEPFKRVVEFLEMVAATRTQSNGAAAFLVVGEPGSKEYARHVQDALHRLALQNHVTFLQRTDDIDDLMAGLDVLVTMSGGSVMFEAMAAGNPVLSIRTDDRHSVHTRHAQTAWCVTTDRPTDAANALLHLLANPDLRIQLGTAGRNWARQHLSVNAMVTKTQSFYDTLLLPPLISPSLKSS